jgi:hypothetical protein
MSRIFLVFWMRKLKILRHHPWTNSFIDRPHCIMRNVRLRRVVMNNQYIYLQCRILKKCTNIQNDSFCKGKCMSQSKCTNHYKASLGQLAVRWYLLQEGNISDLKISSGKHTYIHFLRGVTDFIRHFFCQIRVCNIFRDHRHYRQIFLSLLLAAADCSANYSAARRERH